MSGGIRQVSIKHETSYRFPLENVRAVQTTVSRMNAYSQMTMTKEKKASMKQSNSQHILYRETSLSIESILTEMKTHGLHKKSTTQR